MLRLKYLRLGVGELVAAVAFTLLAYTSVLPRLHPGAERAALWAALIPCLLVLIQAGGYWLLARAWVPHRSMPVGLARVYRAFRVLDAVLLVAGLAGVITWLPDQPLVTVLVFAVWTFGLVEFVNYFLVRLAYPPSQWLGKVGQWRMPRLILDLSSADTRT